MLIYKNSGPNCHKMLKKKSCDRITEMGGVVIHNNKARSATWLTKLENAAGTTFLANLALKSFKYSAFSPKLSPSVNI